MTNAERNKIDQRIALLERASALFNRFGGSIPVAIAFLNRWPTQVELYPHWQVGESWKFFLASFLYCLASRALDRAILFAKADLAP
jgi:hypothetical protein